VWKLSAAERAHIEPWAVLEQVAQHQNRVTADLFDENRLSDEELRRDPLADG
jgi:hypothetical protein